MVLKKHDTYRFHPCRGRYGRIHPHIGGLCYHWANDQVFWGNKNLHTRVFLDQILCLFISKHPISKKITFF